MANVCNIRFKKYIFKIQSQNIFHEFALVRRHFIHSFSKEQSVKVNLGY